MPAASVASANENYVLRPVVLLIVEFLRLNAIGYGVRSSFKPNQLSSDVSHALKQLCERGKAEEFRDLLPYGYDESHFKLLNKQSCKDLLWVPYDNVAQAMVVKET